MIERKQDNLPRYVIVPSAKIKSWRLSGTRVVQCVINGDDIGRRTLKRWDATRWFIELTEAMCRRLNVDTGAHIHIQLTLLEDDLPDELKRQFATHPEARAAWLQLSSSQQRQLAERVFNAKTQATREARAAGILEWLAR